MTALSPASPVTNESLKCGLALLTSWQAARGLQHAPWKQGNASSIQQHKGFWRTRAAVKDYKYYEALTRGGEAVTAMMEDMVEVLKDIDMDNEEEELAVKMAAAGAVSKRLDMLDESFLLALDFMASQAETDNDDRRRSILALMKDTVLEQLSKQSPPQVQVVGLLCTIEKKSERLDILRRSAGGGGVFDTRTGGTLTIPGALLTDISAQADDLLASMEEKAKIPNRKLLAKLVLVREEARNMLGGGVQDKRNDNRGLKNLHESEVEFLGKIVAMKVGPAARARLASVLGGSEEGAEPDDEAEYQQQQQRLIRRKPEAGEKKRIPPVRPGMFVDTVTKVIGAMYSGNARGVTVQQLEWIQRETLEILQEIGFS